MLKLFTKGFPTACLLSNQHEVVHQKALKAMHTLFDMEVGTCNHSCHTSRRSSYGQSQHSQKPLTSQD